jgi:hypothetical protein
MQHLYTKELCEVFLSIYFLLIHAKPSFYSGGCLFGTLYFSTLICSHFLLLKTVTGSLVFFEHC